MNFNHQTSHPFFGACGFYIILLSVSSAFCLYSMVAFQTMQGNSSLHFTDWEQSSDSISQLSHCTYCCGFRFTKHVTGWVKISSSLSLKQSSLKFYPSVFCMHFYFHPLYLHVHQIVLQMYDMKKLSSLTRNVKLHYFSYYHAYNSLMQGTNFIRNMKVYPKA